MIIDDIKAQYKKGGIFPHKYEILITPPDNLFDTNFTKKLRILAKSASIPKKEVKTKTITYKGRPVVLRSQLDFGETCSVSVYEDSEMNVRKTLDKWMDLSDSLEDKSIEDYYRLIAPKGFDINLYTDDVSMILDELYDNLEKIINRYSNG